MNMAEYKNLKRNCKDEGIEIRTGIYCFDKTQINLQKQSTNPQPKESSKPLNKT